MNKCLHSIFLILLSCFFLSAQAPSKFYNKFGGFGSEEGFGIKETINRQYIISGTTSSFGYGGKDATLILIDSMGQKIWEKHYGGALTDVAKSVLFNPSDSGFIFAGFSNSIGNGGYDIYVVRTDKKGDILWQNSFGGLDWDFGEDLLFSNDGHLIVCGKTYSKKYGKSDGCIYKINSASGQMMWEKIYGGPENDDFRSVILTTDNFYVFAGRTESYSDVSGDIYLLKTNLNGDSVLSKTYGLKNKNDYANSIAAETSTAYILGGGSESYSEALTDAFIFKIASNGDSLWLRNYGNNGLGQEATDVFYLNNGAGAYAIAYSDINFAFYKRDPKGLILNDQGYYITGNSFGENEDEELHQVTKTTDQGFIGVGYTRSYGSILEDVYVVKFDSTFLYGGKLINVKNYIKTPDNLKVYPTILNQSTPELTIEFKDCITFSIQDGSGRKVFEETTINNSGVDKYNLDIKFLEKGFYTLNIKIGIESYCVKLIKN
jgi:hypothetical protein